MNAPQALSLVLGCTLGLGLWSLAATLPSLRRPRLADRIAPYILDVSPAAREHVRRRTVDPLPVIGSLAAPVVGAFSSLLSRLFGGPETAALRLRQSGSAASVERLRSEQVICAILGTARRYRRRPRLGLAPAAGAPRGDPRARGVLRCGVT